MRKHTVMSRETAMDAELGSGDVRLHCPRTVGTPYVVSEPDCLID